MDLLEAREEYQKARRLAQGDFNVDIFKNLGEQTGGDEY